MTPVEREARLRGKAYEFSELVGAQTREEVDDFLEELTVAIPGFAADLNEIADQRRAYIDFMSRPNDDHGRSQNP